MNNGSNGNGGAGKRGLPMVQNPVENPVEIRSMVWRRWESCPAQSASS